MTSKSAADAPSGLSAVTLAGLLLAAAQAPLGSTMIAVALPSLAHSLGADLSLTTSLLVTSYLVVNLIGQSPGGKLGDAFGHARTVRAGMILYAAGAIVGVVSTGLLPLVLSRSAMAAGGALVVPATMALLRLHVPQARQGRVFGLVGATMGLSAAIGPPLGGELVSRFGWRAIFAASLPFLVGAALLVRLSPVPGRDPAARPSTGGLGSFDWAGTSLLVVALGTLAVGSRLPDEMRLVALFVGVAALALFIVWELRAKSPVLDPRLFRRRGFAAGSSVIALQNFGMYGLLFQLPQFFQGIRGATPKEVGRVLFAMMAAMFVASPFGGRMADRFGPRKTALAGAVPTLAGILWLLRLRDFEGPLAATPALVLLGLGFGFTAAPAQASAMASVPRSEAGMAAGATSSLRYLGGMLSVLLLGAVFGPGGAGDLAAHETVLHCFTVVLGAATLACLALPDAIGEPVAKAE